MLYILSQFFVIVSDVFFIFSMLSKKKKNIIFYLVFSTILFALQYICLGGWTGAGIAGIELVFLFVMYYLEIKDKTKYNVYVSLITIVATIAISILTWDGAISLIPMFAMIAYLIAMMFKNVIIVKSGTFVRLILNGIYMLLLSSYFGVALTFVIIAFTIWGIVRDNQAKKQVETK